MATKLRILLADHHPDTPAEKVGIRQQDHEVVGTAADGLDAAKRLDPDLIVLNFYAGFRPVRSRSSPRECRLGKQNGPTKSIKRCSKAKIRLLRSQDRR